MYQNLELMSETGGLPDPIHLPDLMHPSYKVIVQILSLSVTHFTLPHLLAHKIVV